ncbi:MAG TPA: hypothetical protein ENI45_02585 [Thermoplasmatales archaeon]|nr:hypothetical protein [Thermoplasmatales archaeon]
MRKTWMFGVALCIILSVSPSVSGSFAEKGGSSFTTHPVSISEIVIRGKANALSSLNNVNLFSPFYRNASFTIMFHDFPGTARVLVDGELQPIECPVDVKLENFTGFGTPPILILVKMVIGRMTWVGVGGITIASVST